MVSFNFTAKILFLMTDNNSMSGFDTVCLHGGHTAENNRAHLTPIYASSTYTFDSAEQAVAVFKQERKGIYMVAGATPPLPKRKKR
jgi:methionine-gamma-lyase